MIDQEQLEQMRMDDDGFPLVTHVHKWYVITIVDDDRTYDSYECDCGENFEENI